MQSTESRFTDILLPEKPKASWERLLDVFLPAGYPHSVTDDYLEYQIYDSLQAFASSIAGMLSSRAVLSSVGVGDSTASPTAALLLSVLQESAGRLATILFAHRFGTALEPECKMYRLLADILNDFAFVLDCLSPSFPKPIRVVVLSTSSILRALCGVAAGSAKASLSAHFARWSNLGELNAKDSSQETVISLLGMLAGSLVVSWVTTPVATWTTLILLLSVHLEMNRRAVRAVSMRTLNRQRATLVYHQLRRGKVPTPEEISKQERIFEWDGVLRDDHDRISGFCLVGGSMQTMLAAMSSKGSPYAAVRINTKMLEDAITTYRDRAYILVADNEGTALTGTSEKLPAAHRKSAARRHFHVVLKKGAKPSDILVAWWHALAWMGGEPAPAIVARDMLRKNEEALSKVGWNLDIGAVETKSSTRVCIDS